MFLFKKINTLSLFVPVWRGCNLCILLQVTDDNLSLVSDITDCNTASSSTMQRDPSDPVPMKQTRVLFDNKSLNQLQVVN